MGQHSSLFETLVSRTLSLFFSARVEEEEATLSLSLSSLLSLSVFVEATTALHRTHEADMKHEKNFITSPAFEPTGLKWQNMTHEKVLISR